MKKIITLGLAICVAAASVPAQVMAEGANTGSITKGDQTYISIRNAASQAGYSIAWQAEKKAIQLTKAATVINVYPNFKWYQLNGDYKTLPEPLMLINGTNYLTAAGIKVLFNEPLAAGKTAAQLTESAITASNELKILRNTLDKNQETLTDAERGINALLPNLGNGVTDKQANDAWLSVLGSRIQEDITKKGIINQQDILTMQVNASCDSLIANIKTEELYKENVGNAESAVAEAALKYQNGVISQIEFDKAKNAVATAKANLTIQQATIKELKNSLSKLTGLSAEQINPTGDLALTPLKDFNLEGAYNTAVSNSYSLYVLNKNSLMVKYGLDYFVFNVGAAPSAYRAQELDLSNAQIQINQAKDALHKVMLNTWQDIVKAEEKDRMLSVQLREKRNDLDTLRLQRSLGLVTDQQFRSAWLAVEELELAIVGNTVQHRQLMRVLEKPWLSN